MRCDQSNLGAERPAGWRVLSACLLLVGALLNGCTAGRPPLSPADQREVANLAPRARDLLVVAARSDVDVLSCNGIEALAQVAPRDGLEAFRSATRSSSPLVRFAGYAAMGDVRDRASLAQINQGMQDSEPRVRLAAAYAAVRCGNQRGSPLLAYAVVDEPDENLRTDAAMLIGRLGDKRTVKWLRAALTAPKNRNSTKNEIAIHQALASLGDRKSLEQLIEFASARYDVLSRVLALQALSEIGAREARSALSYRLNSTDDYLETRLIAARGLGKIGDAEGYELALESTRYVSTNKQETPETQQTDTMRIRSLAVMALGDIGDPRALPVLAALAESPDDQRVQIAAAFAILKIAGQSGGI